jgi:hypothetical protein
VLHALHAGPEAEIEGGLQDLQESFDIIQPLLVLRIEVNGIGLLLVAPVKNTDLAFHFLLLLFVEWKGKLPLVYSSDVFHY